jgi:hypothetical protein
MEITTELLQKIYERAYHVFMAKTGREAETIELLFNGGISCSYSYSYNGCIEKSSKFITADVLDSNLDELIEIRKQKEESERQEALIRLEAAKKAKRMADYKELRKEFDEMAEIAFAEWLNNNEWVKRNRTHPKHVGKYFSNIHCEYKEIGELLEIFRLEKINQ